MIGNPAGPSLDVRFVLALRADAGDAQEFAEFGQVLIARIVNPLNKIHMGLSETGILSVFGSQLDPAQNLKRMLRSRGMLTCARHAMIV